MKIETNPVRISAKFSTDPAKDLKEGNTLSVKIIERLGNNHAVLDINGRKIDAEFLQGIPDTGRLSLVLERRTGSALFFRIAGTPGEIFTELKRSVILTQSDLYKSLHNPELSIKEGSIFALNKALLAFAGLIKEDKGNSGSISDRLLSAGINRNAILFINALIYSPANRIFQQIYQILSGILPGSKYPKDIKSDQINELIEEIIDSLEKTGSDGLIGEIIDLLVNHPDNNDKKYGKIAYIDDNKLKECEYIVYENNIFLSLNLSSLGGLDILIKQEKSLYSIFFYCENKDGKAALKREIPMLEKALSLLPEKNFSILFFNNKKAVEKIIEIISSMDINYLLDIKA